MTAIHYRPSNKVPRAGMLAMVLVSLAALPVAVLYAWVTSRLPVVVNPFVLCGAAALVGAIAGVGCARGKIRNPRWMGWAGAGIGLLAWCIQWAAWAALQTSGDAPSALPHAGPGTVLAAAAGRLAAQSSGWMQWGVALCWSLELCLYLVLPMAAGRKRASAPFCEASDTWARKVDVPVQFAFIREPEAVRRRLESDPRQLESVLVPLPVEFSGSHALLTLYRCAGPESFFTLHNYYAMRPDASPLPAEMRNALEAGHEVEYYAEGAEPVVELLRVPLADPDASLRRWAAAADGLSAQAGANGAD